MQKVFTFVLLIVFPIMLDAFTQSGSMDVPMPEENATNREKVQQVLIHLKNISQGNPDIPASNGIIRLERRRYRQQAQTLDAMASFYDVPANSDYTIKGFHMSHSDAFDNAAELWGIWDDIEISNTNHEFTFERNMPYINDVTAQYSRNNLLNPSLQINEPVVFDVYLRNPSRKTFQTQVVVMLKNMQTGEIIKMEEEILLQAAQTRTVVTFSFIPKEQGEYHFAAGLYLKQRINEWSDCWSWSKDPLFFVSKEHRTISFAGYKWDVKAGFGNPGSNFWTSDSNHVWIDGLERLNLTLATKDNGRWYATEVISQETFGYGTYTFNIDSRPDQFDPHVVAGIFIYRDEQNEIDIEFSRWGDNENYQYGNYVVQPSDNPGNQFRFPFITQGSFTTHRIEWKPGEIQFTSWHGHYPEPQEGKIIAQWQYAGPNVPPATEMKLFFNIWLFRGIQPKSDKGEIFTISGFNYQPCCMPEEPGPENSNPDNQ